MAGAFWPSAAETNRRAFIAAALITLLALLSTAKILHLSYADPLMTAALVSSAALLIAYAAAPNRQYWLIASAACATVAAFTKQPAVLWTCAVLPTAVAIGAYRGYWPWHRLAASLVGAAVVGVWLLLHFTDITRNQGVLEAALGDRSVWATVWNSALRYFFRKPHLLILLVAAWHFSRRDERLHGLWWLGALPLTALWFTLGSYELRHGVHVLWFSVLILLAALLLRPDPIASSQSSQSAQVKTRTRHFSYIGAIVVFALPFGLSFTQADYKGTDLNDGQKMAFMRQMGSTAGSFFDDRVDAQSRIWTTSNYSYGLFYGRLPVGRPRDHGSPSTAQTVMAELQNFRADFAVSSGFYAYGQQSKNLAQLAEYCPNGLRPELVSDDGEFVFFSVHQAPLNDCMDVIGDTD